MKEKRYRPQQCENKKYKQSWWERRTLGLMIKKRRSVCRAAALLLFSWYELPHMEILLAQGLALCRDEIYLFR